MRPSAPQRLALLLPAASLAWAPAAFAHVKWFCTTVDVTAPPVPLRQVLSPTFFACCAAFGLLILLGVFADGWLARWWPGALSTGGRLRRIEEFLIRAAIGAYCMFLYDHAAVVPWGRDGAILTPELIDHDQWIGNLQLLVAALLVWRRTCGLAALGLLALLGIGVARYGVFHMTDYVYFIGLAAYLALTPAYARALRHWRMPVLGASLGLSLMWTAVEKFLYPEWTAEILVTHPSLTFGFPVPFTIVAAGFVEFSLAFYLIAGRGLIRLGALAFTAVFVSAIPEFGALDSVGHLPIIAILLAVAIRGTTPLQDRLRLAGSGPAVNAAGVGALYAATLTVMVALYYGLQLTATRR